MTLLLCLAVLLAPHCKKNPITPNAGDLQRPVIWLNSFEFAFSAYETGGDPAGQVLTVKNSSHNTLQYTISDDADWLSVEPANGTSSGQPVEHAIYVRKEGLAAQEADYEATITVVCPEAYNNPQRVHVNLNVAAQPPPEIRVDPSGLRFSAEADENPADQTLRIMNAGMGTLTYDITWDAGWLSVSPSSGNSDGEARPHSVSVFSENLPEGTYGGTITVRSPGASNSPRGVAVRLEVKGAAPVPAENEISVACEPASARTGTLILIPISIRGNLRKISTYGSVLTFDNSLFDYVGTNKGSLTGNWSMVDGYLSGPGKVTIGGFSGTGSDIPVGSVGSIAVVTLRVTGAGYSDGRQSQLALNAYSDDIAGMNPEPATTKFTYRQ